jgi:hypothetical protein
VVSSATGRMLWALWHDWMSAEDDYVARERPDLGADLVVSGTVHLP